MEELSVAYVTTNIDLLKKQYIEFHHVAFWHDVGIAALSALQVALLYLCFGPGPVDGAHGRRTHSALIQFQERFGLPETGGLDRGTEDKLLAKRFSVASNLLTDISHQPSILLILNNIIYSR